ncbi:hypothetical protein Syun_028181 [Stephania yunnanensis]|uniref:Uncharacterized protein n=1 Tax=Stephania yunnanensis TaxID=152371 RepID=A0AAP0HRW8_9MAGN
MEIHGYFLLNRIVLCVYLNFPFINICGLYEQLVEVLLVLDEILKGNLVCWNSLIDGYMHTCVIYEYLVEALSMSDDVYDLDKHGVCLNFLIIGSMHIDCFLKELQMDGFELSKAMTTHRPSVMDLARWVNAY